MKRSLFTLALLAGTTAAVAQQAGMLPGVDKAAIDTSAKPGDGFDRYANGTWRAQAQIPADRSSVGVGVDVFKVAEARNAAIIAGAGVGQGARSGDQRKIADYYAAYLDTAGIDARGLTPIKPQLSAIAAIRDKRALATMLGAALRADTDPVNASNFHTENLFGLFVSQDLDQPTVTIPYLMQGGLGLSDRDYYLSDTAEMGDLRIAYGEYVGTVLRLAGYDAAHAAAAAQRVLALETKIARVHAPITDGQDAHKADNHWTRAEFASHAPGLDWGAFWQAAGLAQQQRFGVWQPGAVTGEAGLIASEPLAAWQDWLAFHTLNQVAGSLPKPFRDASFAFNGTLLSGTPQQQPRDRLAIAAVNGSLGDAVGRIYAERYFPASSKREIQGMVRNIIAAFDARLARLDWLSPATKAEARRKLQVLIVGVGYPETWRDYAGLDVRRDDPVGNLQRARLFEYHHQLAKIGRPVDRAEWWMTPQTVNAVNLPLQNALNFPAAILESPYFDARFDAAANYGAIGAIIGHEISHSFDNLGADFDSAGRLHNWWTPADFKHFQDAGAALAKQYDAYEALPGLHLNGTQELGENIADVAGLTAALDAYHASLGGKPAPVIDGLSGDQRFFLAFAQSWRTKMRDKALRARIATDVHAPAMWRVETVRNLDAWYDAFDIKPGQARYLAPSARVHVW
jgi:putative endopeptidase